ncbi:MAG: hypothetical protein RL748_579 [Pseudomonadota bacterium]|jgi:hypothetical protein
MLFARHLKPPCMHQPDHFLHGIQRLALRATLHEANRIESWHDWFPITLDEHHLIWRHIPQRFTTPFFADLLSQQSPTHRQVCLTPLDHLPHLPATPAPAAFIFHTSRCGSTLLTQMLATLPQCIAISEAPIIDVCLRASPATMRADQQLALLRYVILALGQRRQQESACIIKLDCWHLPYLPMLRAAFPDTPCWFLYREPQAVLASHQRQRGPQMVPGMIFPQQLPTAGTPLAAGDLDGYCIQVLALLFQSALGQCSAHPATLHLLNYQQLPHAVWQQFLPQLGIHPEPDQLAALQARAGFHAKQQGTPFAGDASSTLSAASTDLLQSLVLPQYQKLEQQRICACNALL